MLELAFEPCSAVHQWSLSVGEDKPWDGFRGGERAKWLFMLLLLLLLLLAASASRCLMSSHS